jgi:hypothetical protein
MNWILLAAVLSSAPALAADTPAPAKKADAKASAKPATNAAEADNEVVERRTCKKDGDERTLEVLPKERGCILQYTKAGKSETKANASHGVQVCRDTLGKIQARLEQAGFHCE